MGALTPCSWQFPQLYTIDLRLINYVLTHSMDYYKPEESRKGLSTLLGEGLRVLSTRHYGGLTGLLCTQAFSLPKVSGQVLAEISLKLLTPVVESGEKHRHQRHVMVCVLSAPLIIRGVLTAAAESRLWPRSDPRTHRDLSREGPQCMSIHRIVKRAVTNQCLPFRSFAITGTIRSRRLLMGRYARMS